MVDFLIGRFVVDIEILKRKVSTFKTPGGQLRDVSNDLLMEILNAWESWEGSNNSFYAALGSNRYKMASLLGKAKKLKREGYMASEFEEVKVEMPLSAAHLWGLCSGISLGQWKGYSLWRS